MKLAKEQKPEWIWYGENRTIPCTFILFRKEIEIQGLCESASGYIAADSRYKICVNGTLVQRGPAPFDPRHQEIEPLNILPYLKEGRNTIGVTVCYFGYGEGTYIPGVPGLWLVIDIKTGNEKVRIVSDSSWKVYKAKSWKAKYQRTFLRALVEDFDARIYPYGWDMIGFDDSLWGSAEVLDVPEGKPVLCARKEQPITGLGVGVTNIDDFSLKERSIPLLNENKESCVQLVDSGYIVWKKDPEEYFDSYTKDAFYEDRDESPIVGRSGESKPLFPVSIKLQEGKSGLVLFKLEEEMTGYPFIHIHAEENAIVEVVFSEAREEGRLMPLSQSYGGCGQWFRVTAGSGDTYHEAFDYEAVMYMAVLIRGNKGVVEIKDAGVIRRVYPFKGQPAFMSTDKVLNKVFHAGLNTLKNICQETMVDNMVRERQNYSGETGMGKIALYYAFGEYRLPERSLRVYLSGQTKEGWFIDPFPSFDRCGRLWQKTLGISYWGIVIDTVFRIIDEIYYYILYSGNMKFLEEYYKRIIKHDNWLRTMEKDNGLLPLEWNYHTVWIDHVGFKKEKHKQAALNLYYYRYLNCCMASIHEWAGDSYSAELCRERAQRVKEALYDKYWDNEKNTFVDNLPWIHEEKEVRMHDRTISLALLNDLIPEENIRHNINILVECPPEMGFSHPCNADYRLKALCKYNRGDIVIEELRNRWGNMRSVNENNTISEMWDMPHPGRNIFAWCQEPGTPVYVAYRDILGIEPVEPGFGKYVIRPQIHDIGQIGGAINTLRGEISLHITQMDEGYIYELGLPKGLEGRIVLQGKLHDVVECSSGACKDELKQLKGRREIVVKPPEDVRMALKVTK